jgi:hypothetical protein
VVEIQFVQYDVAATVVRQLRRARSVFGHETTGMVNIPPCPFRTLVVQEIVVARGSILELLRPDPNTGKVHTLLSHEMFAVIRTMIAFRLTGATKGVLSLST